MTSRYLFVQDLVTLLQIHLTSFLLTTISYFYWYEWVLHGMAFINGPGGDGGWDPGSSNLSWDLKLSRSRDMDITPVWHCLH